MRTLLIIIILLGSALQFGCSNKKGQAKLKINVGKIFNSGTYMDGGVFLVGHIIDDSEKFQMMILDPNKDISIDLTKGKWEFAAIGWAGLANATKEANLFTGTNQCAYSGILDLNTAQVDLVLNLNYAECAGIPNHGAVISNPAHLDSSVNPNQFFNIILESCNSLDVVNQYCVDNNNAQITGQGLTRSLRVGVVGNLTSATKGNQPLPGGFSSCYTVPNAVSAALNLKIPVGNYISGKSEMLMKPSFLLYASDDCSGDPINYSMREESVYKGFSGANQKYIGKVNSTYTRLYVEHNPNTTSNLNGYNRFGYGKDGDLDVPNNGNYYQTPLNEYARVVNMATSGVGTTLTLFGSDGSGINTNDEIIFYVNDSYGGTGCGADFLSGMILRARVASRTVNTITTDHNLSVYELHPPGQTPSMVNLTYPTGASLSIAFNSAGSCSVQIVKVKDYRRLKLGSGSLLKPQSFSVATGYGGILAFKVSDTLELSSNAATAELRADYNYGGLPNLSSQYNSYTTSCYNQGKACMYFGSASSSLNVGGGLIMADINNLYFKTTGSVYFKANVNGGSSNPSGNTANAGHININVGSITADAGVSPSFLLSANSAINSGPSYSGNAGPIHFNYCNIVPPIAINSILIGQTIDSSGSNVPSLFNTDQKCQ